MKPEFDTALDALTPRQRKVLQAFLQGHSDDAIAKSLYLEASTIRRHLANICKLFGLTGAPGERYSHREELVDLFIQFKPDWIAPTHELLKRPNLVAHSTPPPTSSTPPPHASPTPSPYAFSTPPLSTPPLLTPPLLTPTFDFPGTPLSVRSPLYIERPPIEARCYQEIHKPGALIRIRAPRRMGKTSLVHRILAHAQDHGHTVVTLNFRQADFHHLTDLDRLLQWFCRVLTQRLGLNPELDDYWDRDRFGSIVSATAYMQGHILQQRQETEQGPLVLVLEEVDWLLDYPPLAQGFFAMLRGWHEEAKNLDSWQQLRLIVVHSTDVYIPLDIHQSPFNVGLPIQLPRLKADQLYTLAKRYGLSHTAVHFSPTSKVIETLLELLGGHPYLSQLAFYHLAQGESTLADLLAIAPTQSGIYSGHLRRTWDLVHSVPELQVALQSVLRAMPDGVQLNPVQSYKLESMGLVTLRGNMAHMSCGLYTQYWQKLGQT